MYRPDFFLLKNLFLAVAATFLTYSTLVLFGTEISCRVYLPIGMLTFVAYQLASWQPAVTGYLISFKNAPGTLQFVLTLFSAAAGLLLLPAGLLKLLGLPAILTMLYNLQWPSVRLAGGMRAIFLLKNVIVSVVWTYLTFNLPLYPGNPDRVACSGRFILILILTLGLDLRDREADLERNVKTLPGRIGFSRAKQLILILAVCSFVIFMFLSFPGKLSILLSLSIAILVIIYLRPQTGYWTYFFLLDGILLLYALFLLI
jgi:hypothetical protein